PAVPRPGVVAARAGGRSADAASDHHRCSARGMLLVLVCGVRSRRRSSWAFRATTTVEADIRIAPMLMGSTKPIGASTPAASGTESRLYPAAHHKFCFILR